MKVAMNGFCFLTMSILISGLIACTDKNTTTREVQAPQAVQQKEPVKVQMDASFIKLTDGVNIRLRITGLEPNSKHALHIHEVGDCSSVDFMSAGPHFNPDSYTHGAPENEKSHMGDLGNIDADERGVYSGLIKVKKATTQGKYSILNRSLVVHEKSDDYKTQPAGESGNRIACAVIRTIE